MLSNILYTQYVSYLIANKGRLPLAVPSTGIRVMVIVVLTVPFKCTHTSTEPLDSCTLYTVLSNPTVATEREKGHTEPNSTGKFCRSIKFLQFIKTHFYNRDELME